jgi:hypothetical protein
MRFQTAQVLQIAQLTKDTLRTWKKVIRPIAEVDGRRRQFTMGELVGLCMLARATHGLGLPISLFARDAEELFRQLQKQIPPAGSPLVLCITPKALSFSQTPDFENESIIALIKIAPILEEVFAKLRGESPTGAQLDLPFAEARVVALPHSLTGNMKARSRTVGPA